METSTIKGVVERITFQSPETGYTVLRFKASRHNDLVTVVGMLMDVVVGTNLEINGVWKVDRKYGQQFEAHTWQEVMPATVYGIEKYLGSGLIKGIGPKYAKKIVAKFGADTLDIIEENIERLGEVEGIGKKRIQQIKFSWVRQREIKNVMVFLQSHDVSSAYAAKIYKAYGNDAVKRVQENPYQLADDIWGIGFKTADTIAVKMGIEKDEFNRLRSGIKYALGELGNEGHVFAYREQLIKKGKELLDVTESQLDEAIERMMKNDDLKVEEDAIYLPPFYYAEIGAAKRLRMIISAEAEENIFTKDQMVDLGRIQKTLGISYDDVQAEAIHRAANSKVMVLTGGPGTGKTTTTQGIIQAFLDKGLSILLAAPTGRAAKRMSEATGREAKTIHRLLEFKPPEGYKRNEENPLEGDVLLVDECSMIDIMLMNSLLKAVPANMRLVLIGDVDQLPSVGAGNVLRDIIDSEAVPVVRLTKIFRQAQQSRIITNAHKVNEGKFPDISNGKNSDFFFLNREEPEVIAKEIVELVKNKLPNYYKVKPSEIQVLTPMQKGIIGAINLNQELQKAINPSMEGIRRGGYIFKQYDKVMQIRNNYDKEVFNGDIGRILEIDTEDNTLTVLFDGRKVLYEASELDELVQAYACTIHKSQGSEYPIVVMPVSMTHFMMMQRNLIYTGITRSKKVCVVVGTMKALGYAVRNITVTKRNTMLKERLAVK
ncbi:MAG: ATP-dependent RecD-like DNA helicase [Selenomonadaceae bacterium]|nr:ATP-dependent RecD-like DNA helicase [Selenomonadaceae bacterium]